jgi:hypothetical protein
MARTRVNDTLRCQSAYVEHALQTKRQGVTQEYMKDFIGHNMFAHNVTTLQIKLQVFNCRFTLFAASSVGMKLQDVTPDCWLAE